VTGLRSAFHINHILEIRDTLTAIHSPAPADNAVSTLAESSDKFVKPGMCTEHVEELKLFCETCRTLICCQCAIKGSEHHHHDYELIDKAFEKYQSDFTGLLDPLEEQLATFSEALEQVDGRRKEIFVQQTGIEASINHTIRQLQQALEVRRTQLLHSLHKLARRKLKMLAAQHDDLELSQIRVRSCLEFLRGSLVEREKGEMLERKYALEKQVMELTMSFEAVTLKPNVEADMTYCASSEVINILKNHGDMMTPASPCPMKCQVLGDFEEGTVGQNSRNVVQVFNWKGSPSREAIELLQCELISELTGEVVIGGGERKGQGQYEISYQPTVTGRHQLHIKIEDTHIAGSPFSVDVKAPIEKLGAPTLTIEGVSAPWGVAVSKRGETLVTESTAHCVSVFSPRGKILRTFGSYGSGPGQLDSPRGLAITGDGEILVADRNNHRIQKFTADGKFLQAVGVEGKGHLEFTRPRGLIYNPSNNRVYVTDSNHRVQVLNSDLTFSGILRGNSKDHFNFPSGIACDGTGNVYVADRKNNRMQVFTQDGKFLRGFGQHGGGEGDLDSPSGVAVDSTTGNVYVGELMNHRVSVFTSEGEFVTCFGKEGSGEGEFRHPPDLTLNNGALYVCDNSNHRIQIF
jgi:tripartite motif-containing protein 2/3/tripartite motif-containing protein 71